LSTVRAKAEPSSARFHRTSVVQPGAFAGLHFDEPADKRIAAADVALDDRRLRAGAEHDEDMRKHRFIARRRVCKHELDRRLDDDAVRNVDEGAAVFECRSQRAEAVAAPVRDRTQVFCDQVGILEPRIRKRQNDHPFVACRTLAGFDEGRAEVKESAGILGRERRQIALGDGNRGFTARLRPAAAGRPHQVVVVQFSVVVTPAAARPRAGRRQRRIKFQRFTPQLGVRCVLEAGFREQLECFLKRGRVRSEGDRREVGGGSARHAP
jgi:hypothetical protein